MVNKYKMYVSARSKGKNCTCQIACNMDVRNNVISFEDIYIYIRVFLSFEAR